MSRAIERLENRLLFVTINGTNAANGISVQIDGNDILYAVDGISNRVSDFLHNEIEINGLGGNDTITIAETGENTVTVHGGAGADTINLALGSNDMDNIDDFVTVNGDADNDTVTINDQNNQANVNYTVSSANVITRSSVPAVTVNVENVHIHAPTSFISNLSVNAVPTPHVRFEGSATHGNTIFINGNGTETVNYRPDDITDVEGDITYGSGSIDFEETQALAVDNVAAATLTTPNIVDVLHISKSLAGGFNAGGTSGGTGMAVMQVTDTDTFTIDMAASDGGGGDDTLTATGSADFVGVLRVNAGGGENTLRVLSGSWSMTTAVGVGGVNLDTTIDNATVAFQGIQSLRRLTLADGGVASFTGSTGSSGIQHLGVPTGEGTISMGTSNPVTVTGTFSISPNRTLNKSGTGALTINATQSHSAGALFRNNGGSTHFNTDCGSTVARPLDLFSDSGNINLNATQHVDSVSTNFGNINVGANGNRVLVTNSVSIGGEGGTVNLNNNDMIVDYTGASQLANVQALVRAGYNDGSWNGLGINSNTAATNPQQNTGLGLMEATDFKSVHGNVPFAGQTIDNSAILIKYTYYGDTDFNGFVDGDDYARTDFGFNTAASGWLNGDFDHNGFIDGDDYALIDNAFSTQSSVL
jgi:hypothetical protein